MSTRILIADDEPDILGMLGGNLQSAGFEVIEANDGAGALAAARQHLPEAAVLDYQMPGLSGIELCRALRSDPLTQGISILMLTARRSEFDRILAFEMGVDDYVTKPFSPREIILRLRAILRRGPIEPPQPSSLAAGDIELDLTSHRVSVGGVEVELTAIEFKLLAALMQRRDRVLSRENLLVNVWGNGCAVELRTIDTHLRRLREKLGAAAAQICTIRGFGYRLSAA
jgi:two-component system phosphate regulon response regulator PhoB